MNTKTILQILLIFFLTITLVSEPALALSTIQTDKVTRISIDTSDSVKCEEANDSTLGNKAASAEKPQYTIYASDITKDIGCESFNILEAEIEGDVTFSSSDISVAAVSDTGVVTCKNVGAAVITITVAETDDYAETTKNVTVTVKTTSLEQASFKKVTIVTNGISLTWDEINGAEGYLLYRKESDAESYSKIGQLNGKNNLTYTDTNVKSGQTYYYQVQAFTDSGNATGEVSETKKAVYIVPTSIKLTRELTGTQITWTKMAGASGYYVYRRAASQKTWTQVADISASGEITWRDTSAANGTLYYYAISGYKSDSVSVKSSQKSYVRLDAPKVKSWSRKSSTKIKLTWSTNSKADGYQIQYAGNSLFLGAKTKTVKGSTAQSSTITKLTKNKKYYARIRAYKVVNGKTWYSPWSTSSGVKTTKTAKLTQVKKNKKVFEIRTLVGQKVGQYDTIQGSCTDGKYAYYVLNNRNKGNCRIAKVNLSTLKLVKLSGVLSIDHGNDITYDSDKNQLVVAPGAAGGKTLCVVDPKTLKVTERKTISIPSTLAGGSKSKIKNIKGFSAIAYCSGKKQYVVMLRSSYDFMILNSELEPVRYVSASKKESYVMQGIDATSDYIMTVQSPKTSGQKNIIKVYDWDGNYISKINVKKNYEIESIYHVGSKVYVGFYRSYYKTTYKYVVKKVKVNGKTKKKKVKVKSKVLCRDSYVYKLSGI